MFLALLAIAAAFLSLAAKRRVALPTGPPTFSREVVRVFQVRCQSCHRPGGAGPFSLVDYASARPWASRIDVMVRTRQMPPWKPSPGCGDFAAPLSLSESEIRTITDWTAAGAPEGNRDHLPPPLTFSEDWASGEPDMVLRMPVPFAPSPGQDSFRMMPTRFRFDRDVYIDGIEVRPSEPHLVHHVLVHVDTSGKAAALDDADPLPGYRYDDKGNGFDDAAFLGTWIPGDVPFRYPPGHAIKIPKGGEIVFEMHYHPASDRPGMDQTAIGLHFAEGTVRKLVNYGSVDKTGFVIPANDPAHVLTHAWTLPRSMHLLNMGGHMHWLGSRFTATAVPPDGKQECLLDIPAWDVRWQTLYRYANPHPLTAGTRIETRCQYDNTSSNPRNPFNPPRDVGYGGHADREMCFAYFTFTWDDEVVEIRP